MNDCDTLARAVGTYEMTRNQFNRVIYRDAEIERRYHEAGEALIAARAPDAAWILYKLELVANHIEESEDASGWLALQLEDRAREAAARDVDFEDLGRGLTTLARLFEYEEAAVFWVRLIRSAAADAEGLREMRGAINCLDRPA